MRSVAYRWLANAPHSFHAMPDVDIRRHLAPSRPPIAAKPRMVGSESNETLQISVSRTYDCALAILGAYKLTGHFPTELEVVLRDLGVLDQISYEISPKTMLTDARQVAFRPYGAVPAERFSTILQMIDARIGADTVKSWWVRLFA